MKDKKQLVLNFGHLWLIAMEILVIAGAFGEEGIITTRFYTTDSNVLCFLASIGYLFFRKKNPKAVTLLRFLSTTCLLVTFTVVLTVLGPQKGYADQFLGGMRLRRREGFLSLECLRSSHHRCLCNSDDHIECARTPFRSL